MNSKYTGAQVEALLDTVSGKTIYTEGSGITIEDGVISCTGGSIDPEILSGYTTLEQFESLDEATSQALVRIKADYLPIDKAAETYATIKTTYTQAQADAKFVDNSELTDALVDFMKSDVYHSIHDPQEKAIAAALVSHDERITVLEVSGGTTYTAGTGIEITEDNVINCTVSGGTVPDNIVTGVDKAYKVKSLTMDEYNALETKDADTLYYVDGVATASGVTYSYDDSDVRSLINALTNRVKNVEDTYVYTAGTGIEITSDKVINCTVSGGTDEGYWDTTEA